MTRRPATIRDRLTHRYQIEIVDQHHVGNSNIEHFSQLLERIDLDLDLDQMPSGLLGAREHRRDAAGHRDVVVLDQHRVVEAEAVIVAAAATHRVFFQRAQSRRGLARANDARLGMRDAGHELGGSGGDAGEMAEKVERDTLGAEDGAGIAGNRHQLGAGLDRRAVARMRRNRDVG